MERLLGGCFLRYYSGFRVQEKSSCPNPLAAGLNRQCGRLPKNMAPALPGFLNPEPRILRLDQLLGFLLAKTPKTAFIRIGPSDAFIHSFHANLFLISIAHGYRDCQWF
jgi:hypothetical protein